MKKVALSLVILGVLLNGFADEKVLTAQEQKEKAEQIKIKTIEVISKTMLEILEEVKKEPMLPPSNIKDIPSYEKQQDSESFGLLKAHSIAIDPRSNLKNSKDSEMVGKCYGAILSDEKIDKLGIDKVISTSQCIKELVALKLILNNEKASNKSQQNIQ